MELRYQHEQNGLLGGLSELGGQCSHTRELAACRTALPACISSQILISPSQKQALFSLQMRVKVTTSMHSLPRYTVTMHSLPRYTVIKVELSLGWQRPCLCG